MGYTHYYQSNKPVTGYEKAVPTISKILNKYKNIIQYEYDVNEPAECNADRICFNGLGNEGHETFIFNKMSGFKFCKTARKAYDIVVCEVLLALNWYCPELKVSSDGMSGYSPADGLLVGDCVNDEDVDGTWAQAVANVKEYGIKYAIVCSNMRGKYFDWELERIEEDEEQFFSENLDQLVHDVASEFASKANNNGYHGQMEFLTLVCGLTNDEIAERLRSYS